jgi:hypothetical protein
MNLILGLTHHDAGRLAELACLLMLFAGVWLAAGHIPQFKFGAARSIVPGIALALAGLLLGIAIHWGRFG